MNPIRQLRGQASILLTSVSALILLGVSTTKATQTYPQLIQQDNPVAYYRLEELAGAPAPVDSSTNGIAGIYNFDSTSAYPQLALPGIDIYSVAFNGGSDFASITIPYNIVLSPTNVDGVSGAPFSAECWARPTSDSLSDYTSPLAMSGAYTGTYPSGSGWNFYQTQGPGSTWALFIRGGAVYTFNGPAITLLKWYHLAVTWDGTNAAFYVNGASQGSAAINYKAVDPTTGYSGAIGAGPQTGHGAFAGGVDEVAFYDYALSGAQIQAHYALGTNSFSAPPTRPAILTDLLPATNFSGTTASFKVLANGTDPLTYHWFRGTTPLPAVTGNSYSFTAHYPADDGATFSVIITNAYGAATSSVVSLSVLTNVTIAGPPFSITRNVGSHAAFRVAAGGAIPITYKWSVSTNGGTSFATIAGQTNDTLWLTNVQLSMDGSQYAVLVSNPFTTFDSSVSPAILNVQARAVNVPITGYAKVVMADNPVAYWRLDETNSLVATDAAGSFDGAYDNSLGNLTDGILPGIPHETKFGVDLSDTNEIASGQGGVVSMPYA
ncbi:MAG: Immunoglobulin I-set domain protein, partial [Pedosphaera sp.]|nr:Immunoglobulin I-set domain protein [Pedosphaera sp.]